MRENSRSFSILGLVGISPLPRTQHVSDIITRGAFGPVLGTAARGDGSAGLPKKAL